jgi:hypothetical protein
MTVSSGLVPVLGLAVVIDVSQLGFKKTIQPMSHASPLVVHFGGVRLALDDMHIVTHILRLIASERARCNANVKSELMLRMALRETNTPTAGAASEAMIAKMAIVTINSMSVKPAFRCVWGFMACFMCAGLGSINVCGFLSGTTT